MTHHTPIHTAAALEALTPLQKLRIARMLCDQCEDALVDRVIHEGRDACPAEGSREWAALDDALAGFEAHLEAVFDPRNVAPECENYSPGASYASRRMGELAADLRAARAGRV